MKNRRWIALAGLLVLVGIVCVVLAKRCGTEETERLPMEDTMASIEEVRLRGELYVCSAMIEDYTRKQMVEENLLWANEEHSCVQTMRQKCSYKVDMEKVEYQVDDSTKVVLVKLPALEYVATTQSASFLSDDPEYWAEHLPNTNEMKRMVEGQIRRRFDTAENRRKAERYAEDAIGEVMGKMGYEVEFVRMLERRTE